MKEEIREKRLKRYNKRREILEKLLKYEQHKEEIIKEFQDNKE